MSEHHISEHHDSASVEYGTGQKTLKTYLIGFFLCVALTLIPFWLVAKHAFSSQTLYVLLLGLAFVQLYVQVVFFLRLNTSPRGRWHLTSFLFMAFVVFALVVGSIWVMASLNYNMAM